MKIFSSAQASTVGVIILISLLISNVALDRIANGSDGNVALQHCDSFTYSITGSACRNINYSTTRTGWPFPAHEQYTTAVATEDYSNVVNGIPLSSDGSISLSLNGGLLILLSLGLYIFLKRSQLSVATVLPDLTDTVSDIDGPILSSSDMLSEDGLTSMNKDVLAGYSYNLLTNKTNRTMMFITLHGNTELHLVAVGNNSKLSLPLTKKIENHYLTVVNLEGDFPDYFHLYCSPDKEIEIREVLEPTSMALLVDFCQSYDLEIFKDSLYLSVANNTGPQVEESSLVTDTEKLLEKIGPQLDRLAS